MYSCSQPSNGHLYICRPDPLFAEGPSSPLFWFPAFLPLVTREPEGKLPDVDCESALPRLRIPGVIGDGGGDEGGLIKVCRSEGPNLVGRTRDPTRQGTRTGGSVRSRAAGNMAGPWERKRLPATVVFVLERRHRLWWCSASWLSWEVREDMEGRLVRRGGHPCSVCDSRSAEHSLTLLGSIDNVLEETFLDQGSVRTVPNSRSKRASGNQF